MTATPSAGIDPGPDSDRAYPLIAATMVSEQDVRDAGSRVAGPGAAGSPEGTQRESPRADLAVPDPRQNRTRAAPMMSAAPRTTDRKPRPPRPMGAALLG
jgi:hypothetical protein